MEHTDMDLELNRLPAMTVPELVRRHVELFGREPQTPHRQFLIRKIAWRLQADRQGGLAEEVRQYALAIARNLPIRKRVAENASRRGSGLPINRTISTRVVSGYDSRLPLPGSLLIKEFRGETHVVKVLDEGFEYDGRRFRSLSAIAQEISGTKWNGFLFFGLNKESRHATNGNSGV